MSLEESEVQPAVMTLLLLALLPSAVALLLLILLSLAVVWHTARGERWWIPLQSGRQPVATDPYLIGGDGQAVEWAPIVVLNHPIHATS